MNAKHNILVNNPCQRRDEVILTAEQREVTDLVKALHTVETFKKAALKAAKLGTLEDFAFGGDHTSIDVKVQLDGTVRVVLNASSIG